MYSNSLRYIARKILGKDGTRIIRYIFSNIWKYLKIKEGPYRYREYGVKCLYMV